MDFIKLLDSLSNKDLLNKKGSRRESFGQFSKFGKNMALASIPFGLAATSSKAGAATKKMASAAFMADNNDVLNFALTLEYLERNFYQIALDTNGLIPAEDRVVFETIYRHEKSHVDFFSAALGPNAIDEPTFDFSGAQAGLDLPTFTDYPTFMALAQGFEDTGVRAFKGQAGALANDNELLTFALQVHSVEARHASQVRRMRGSKGWITQAENNLPAPFAPIYAGEANTVQGGVDLAGMFSDFGGNDAVTEAFDEPLTMDEVLTIGGIFIVPE
ncbi:ferritin-like domain-containing protein [Subsaximicrobium wynnwilliamsii]|uniref:Ferritin-like domain-containing protein n=1 Tax=Subsaximicrobium wynnwilliamsii TaxID=291179 RepID=A0A5C6ZLU1_9FLAO|nr:ferritin-like domain-containing protein [Subsaximicrobium wynnwilliamsii]TXD85409.1 ferritin-like domain-containing protein [Subsaximicrobium wynnwilliamsii]TXD90762.1 ferritin-like domain-containing protein [Subsaximicrobium wynnwilliamsii]TXE05269.1 ferritin-like domain-containing protein [Subsaximicrobium wynnwilliamsii]